MGPNLFNVFSYLKIWSSRYVPLTEAGWGGGGAYCFVADPVGVG